MLNNVTHYGLDEASTALNRIHEIGMSTMNDLLKEVESPHEEKFLRTWGITEASEMVGRTPQYIRSLEKQNKLPFVNKNYTNRRAYTLENINQMRNLFGTRYHRPKGTTPMILAVSNFKGGCAKTTTSLHLSQKCALEGLRTLLIDLDPQATATLLMGILPDVHLDYDDTIAETLISDPALIKQVIRSTYFTGLDLIPSNLAVQDAEFALPRESANNHERLGSPMRRLKLAIDLIEDQYDVIIMDCGPNTGALTINALSACTGMLVPLPPAMENFGSFVTFASSLSMLFEALDKKLQFFKLLLTRVPTTIEANMVKTMIRTRLPGLSLENVILSTVEVEKASAQLSTVYELRKPIKNSASYRRAMDSINAVNTEIIDSFKEIWENSNA